MTEPKPPAFIQAVIRTYPPQVQKKINTLRTAIYEIASETKDAGKIIESLKWNEPSYSTRPKTGTPIRLAWHKKTPDTLGLYVPCQTSLINTLKKNYPNKFIYDGTRGIIFSAKDNVSDKVVGDFIKLALTYYKE